jgi:hypothetical protein
MERYSSSCEPIRSAQKDLANAIKAITTLLEQDPTLTVLDPHDGVTQTDVAIVTSALLNAANIEIFELALWQAWGIPGAHPPEASNARNVHE